MDIWGTVIVIIFFVIIVSKILEKSKGTKLGDIIKKWTSKAKEKTEDFTESPISKIYVKQGLKM